MHQSKNITSVLALAWAVVSLTPATADGQSAPPTIMTLARREQALSRTAYNWRVDREEKVTPASPEKIADMQERAAAGLSAIYRSRGVTDEKLVQKYIAGINTTIAERNSGADYTNSAIWHMSRASDQILVAGTAAIGGVKTEYRQFYSGDSGIVVSDAVLFATKPGRPNNPVAWASSGDATRYRCPFLGNNLGVFPEHFVTLMGLNPLAMYGAKWVSVPSDANTWVFNTRVEQGALSPFSIQLTLSRTHNNAPSEIKIVARTFTEDFRTLSFRQYRGEWIADKVEYVDDRPGIDTINETFTLQNVSEAGPLGLTPKPREAVIDYRLLGPDFLNPHLFVSKLDSQQQDQLVTYDWPGDFPSKDQLRQLLSQQRPGESAPDPGKSASLPFVGGIMALTGAVWLFKRRSGSA